MSVISSFIWYLGFTCEDDDHHTTKPQYFITMIEQVGLVYLLLEVVVALDNILNNEWSVDGWPKG